ncbi:6802_t:CDS:2 [Paraglomus occultum]|uniref:Elongation of fatty acids protein n=1 Tax=Paraglomus occultum TaxID=144539 RepID=A0A9N9AAD4_9GLOM|nr:6802_t:CDS:2 [Paraglomus occultum]
MYSWDYSQLASPNEFGWSLGVTPLSNLSVIVSAWVAYFVVVMGCRNFMKSRPPMSLRMITAAHNLILCVWSALMCAYAIIDFYSRWKSRGFGECFCTSDESSLKGRLIYVTYIYYLSKYYELFDTVILALKKKPIIFLHWYHHAIVILMVWSWLEDANMYAR